VSSASSHSRSVRVLPEHEEQLGGVRREHTQLLRHERALLEVACNLAQPREEQHEQAAQMRLATVLRYLLHFHLIPHERFHRHARLPCAVLHAIQSDDCA